MSIPSRVPRAACRTLVVPERGRGVSLTARPNNEAAHSTVAACLKTTRENHLVNKGGKDEEIK